MFGTISNKDKEDVSFEQPNGKIFATIVKKFIYSTGGPAAKNPDKLHSKKRPQVLQQVCDLIWIYYIK